MDAVVFMARNNAIEPEEVGRAELDGDRVRIAPANGADLSWIASTRVFDRRGTVLTPADGRRYLEALPLTFRGTYFWAEPARADAAAD